MYINVVLIIVIIYIIKILLFNTIIIGNCTILMLITSTGKNNNSKYLINIINEFNIQQIIIVKESNDIISNFMEEDNLDKINDENLKLEINTLQLTIEVLKSLDINYSYIEIDNYSTQFSIISYLSRIINRIDDKTIIDVNSCSKNLMPIFIQLGNFNGHKVSFTIQYNSSIKEIIKNAPIQINSDPDNETHILKEILSLFVYKTEFYSFLPQNLDRPSNLILNEINEILGTNRNVKRSYPYILACLSNLSKADTGKPPLLIKRQNTEKRRELVFSLTDYGLLALFLWYISHNHLGFNKYLSNKLAEIFEEIDFNEIKFEYHSNKIVCNVCSEFITSPLLTCTLCGFQSCKNCLNTHYLTNKCQSIKIESKIG